MKSLRKKASVLLACVGLSTAVLAPNARAGVALALLSLPMNQYGSHVGFTFLVIGGTTALVGLATGSVTLVLLGPDGNVPRAELEAGLATELPFLRDHHETLGDLASALMAKVASVEKTDLLPDEPLVVALSEQETRDILFQTDLPEEKVRMVIDFLK